MKPKLTKTERYLLLIIAKLRGSACDAWARARYTAEGKTQKERLERMRAHMKLEDLLEGTKEMNKPEFGARLPWHNPKDHGLTSSESKKMLVKHMRKTMKLLKERGGEP